MRIVEINRRSIQGKTEPFICKNEEGEMFFVKGRHAGYDALVREYVAAKLAEALELPIAPFCIAEMPETLVKASLVPGALDLGWGEVFASREVEFADELRWTQVREVDASLAAQILVFDWWIGNVDRILSDMASRNVSCNPNLLWVAERRELIIIDHNLAFLPRSMPETWAEFCDLHVFE